MEVYRDRALALPPLNTTLARRMMEQTRVFTALQGVRGRPPVDLVALEHLLVRFSSLVVEQRWIKEIDINPLLASPQRLLTLDARVVLHEAEMCFIDYKREMALVADHKNPQTGQDEIIGVGRIIKAQGAKSAEVAILVTDQFQRKGLGTELLRQLIQFSHDEQLQRLTGNILVESEGMQEVCKKLGFHLQYSPEEQVMKAELEL